MICSHGVPLVKLMTLNTWIFQVIIPRNSLLNIKSPLAQKLERMHLKSAFFRGTGKQMVCQTGSSQTKILKKPP